MWTSNSRKNAGDSSPRATIFFVVEGDHLGASLTELSQAIQRRYTAHMTIRARRYKGCRPFGGTPGP